MSFGVVGGESLDEGGRRYDGIGEAFFVDQVGLPQLMKDPPSIKITTILVVLSRTNWFYGSENIVDS